MESIHVIWHAAKRVLAICVIAIVPDLGWGFGSQVFHLVDDATGKPLLILPSGEPEAFIEVGGRPLFVGYNTKMEIETDDSPQKNKYPRTDGRTRFKLRNENRWILVEEWCCNEYTYRMQSRIPAWGEYYNKLIDLSERFGDQLLHEFAGYPEATDCVPFAGMPSFVIDPTTQKPKWIKYFAVARRGWDSNFKYCSRETWNINAYAAVGSSLDSKSVLVAADDTGGSIALLRVSIETGNILEPRSTNHKAIDFEDVERFKTTFLQLNKCPAFTAQELARKDRYKATSAGRCMIQRRIRYEEGIMRHFMGKPSPPLEH